MKKNIFLIAFIASCNLTVYASKIKKNRFSDLIIYVSDLDYDTYFNFGHDIGQLESSLSKIYFTEYKVGRVIKPKIIKNKKEIYFLLDHINTSKKHPSRCVYDFYISIFIVLTDKQNNKMFIGLEHDKLFVEYKNEKFMIYENKNFIKWARGYYTEPTFD